MPGPPVWHVCAHPPSLGQIMVWRESSWAAHYQSPLPASDTLFTEALGADSPGRRQPTQGTSLPTPHTPALSLLGLANSWAHIGLHCPLGHPPSYPSLPSTPKVQPSSKEPLKFSAVSQPHKLLPWRGGLWVLVPLPEPHLPLVQKASRETQAPLGPFPPSHLADSTPGPQQERQSVTLVW